MPIVFNHHSSHLPFMKRTMSIQPKRTAMKQLYCLNMDRFNTHIPSMPVKHKDGHER